MTEEPFGPVAPILTDRTLDEAIARANSTPCGLGSYAFTNAPERQERLSRELEAGMVGINEMMLAHPEAPFGGAKHSGVGAEPGSHAIKHQESRPRVGGWRRRNEGPRQEACEACVGCKEAVP